MEASEMEQLIALASEVAKYRADLLYNKMRLGDMQDAFNDEHASLIEGIKRGTDALQGAESDLRKATVEAYLADPNHNKAVLPGVVAIREVSVVDYDPEKALAWAKEHGSLALRLDEKVYRMLVTAGQAPGTIVVEPQATIARNIILPTQGVP